MHLGTPMSGVAILIAMDGFGLESCLTPELVIVDGCGKLGSFH